MLKLCTAKIIADSISEKGKRITTFELEYPRIIHSELMTHRVFSRNAMSSRAVPVGKMLQQIVENPAMPVRFGVNKRGMEDGTRSKDPCRVYRHGVNS
ncbi:thymidylate synthase [Escherichia phage vB_EcoM-ECP26]|uniref:Thymidylate synthase n=1 Tax=Escherichia phage vB_EcoM-ECP26 TaxID=2576873 RepID=A0A4Y5TVY4_9CAUD|nr:thymidylate synthase [Escherichia phage vB_EcoM-ECP26]